MTGAGRKGAIVALGALLALGAVYLLGPQVEVDTAIARLNLPPNADLPDYFAQREAAIPDVRPGAEKQVHWDGAPGAVTEISVVYLHGFSATHRETAPFADNIAAALGANSFHTRLRGHGRDGAALGAATAGEWLEDAAEALAVGRAIGRRVVVIACSTGATLATYLLASGERADAMHALIFVSPNFGVADFQRRIATGPWGKQLALLIAGAEYSFTPRNDAQSRWWTTRYPTDARIEVAALLDLVDEVDVGTIATPLLIFYSTADRVVDPAATRARFAEFGSTTRRLIEVEGAADPSAHVLVGDAMSPDTTAASVRQAVDFVRALPSR